MSVKRAPFMMLFRQGNRKKSTVFSWSDASGLQIRGVRWMIERRHAWRASWNIESQ
jgi:hypothetical protein